MTDEQMKGIAAQALNMARRDMEQGGFTFLAAAYFERDRSPLFRLRKLEELIAKRCGEGWLNSGVAKDAAFSILRTAVEIMPPAAVVFVTMTNSFITTEKFSALPQAQQKEILESGHDRHHEAVREGWLTREDRLNAVVQTAQRVCMYAQTKAGKIEVDFFPQEGFAGRLKMYGQESAEEQKIAGRLKPEGTSLLPWQRGPGGEEQ